MMETIGQFLRRQREANALSLEEAARQTRIQPQFIEALEGDRFDQMPHLASAKGFLRSYVRFLQLDEAAILKQFSTLYPSVTLPLMPPACDTVSADRERVGYKKEPWQSSSSFYSLVKKTTLGGLFLAFFLIVSISWWARSNQSVGKEQPVLESSLSQGSAVSPDLNLPSRASEGVPETLKIKEDNVASPDPLRASPASSSESLTETPLLLSLEAMERTWVRVLVDKEEVKEALLQSGERVSWKAEETFLLTLGNAGGVKVFLSGKELGILGDRGEVKRDIFLTRATLEQGRVDEARSHQPV